FDCAGCNTRRLDYIFRLLTFRSLSPAPQRKGFRAMPFTMSQASLPALQIGLNALSGVLDKAAAFAAAKKIDPAVLLNSRLAPDMFALTRQVQVATDLAKNGAARLAGVEPPRYEDHETTIGQLKARLAKGVAFIKTLDPK